MKPKNLMMLAAVLIIGLVLTGCNTNEQPAGLTPIPSLAPGATETLVPAIQPQAGGGGQVATGAGPGDAALGAPDYFKNCSPCHGDQGQGKIGPALRNSKFIQSSDDTT